MSDADGAATPVTTANPFGELLDSLLSTTRSVGKLESDITRLEADLVLARRHAHRDGGEQRRVIEDALVRYRTELDDADRQLVQARNVVRAYIKAT